MISFRDDPASSPSSATTAVKAVKASHFRRNCLIVVLLGIGALVGAYRFRAPILTAMANAYIVDQPLEKADAVVALGGGLQYRTFEAARRTRSRLVRANVPAG